MSFRSHSSRRRGLSPAFNPLFEVGIRKIVLESLQPKHRRSLSNSSSSSISLNPIFFKMTSSSSSYATSSITSSQISSSSMIGSFNSHHILVQSMTNPAIVIKKFGLLKFEEDANTTLWHVYSTLHITPAANTLPKFNDHFPIFLGNGTISTKEHLIAFSNACHNIGMNYKDTCMLLFINYLEGKVVVDSLNSHIKYFQLGMN
jgi:hypothetical protein